MNVIEHMMLSKLSHAVQHQSDPLDAASAMAAQEAFDVLKGLDPAKVHGIMIVAVTAAEPNDKGEEGIALATAMAGAPAVLFALNNTAEMILRQAALQEHMSSHPLGALLNEIMGGSSVMSEKASDRFSSEGKTQQ